MTPPVSDPSPDLVVFDGVCVLCNRFARFVHRHDRKRIFRFATAQSLSGRAVYESVGLCPDDLDTVLVRRKGRILQKSDAVLAVLSAFGGFWSVLSLARLVPRRLRDWAYDRIARNRYRLFGRLDACPLPSADLQARFLDDGVT